MKVRWLYHCFPGLLAMLVAGGPALADRIYVDVARQGPQHDGTSWATAYTDLQDALDQAGRTSGPHEIWVARGTYRPDRGSRDRGASFRMLSGTGIYGGFAGAETALDQRDPVANETILSGAIGGEVPDVATNNTTTLVIADGVDSTATLDGFTVTRAYHEGGGPYPGCAVSVRGASAPSNPVISRCVIRDNYTYWDGAVGVMGVGSGATVVACDFIGNRAEAGASSFYEGFSTSSVVAGCRFLGNSCVGGCGVDSEFGAVLVTHCLFRDNAANDSGLGGAIILKGNDGVSLVVADCVIDHNSATEIGGIFTDAGDTVEVRNCTITRNTSLSTRSSGIYIFGINNCTITNCVIWGNTGIQGQEEISQISVSPDVPSNVTVARSIVQHCSSFCGIPSHGNSGQDPMFVDLASGDLHLRPGSPAIDSGDNVAAAIPDSFDLNHNGDTTEFLDLDLRPRFRDDPATVDSGAGHAPFVDRGAYEYAPRCEPDWNFDGVVNSQDFFDFISAFFAVPSHADFNHDGFVNSQDFFDFVAAFFQGCA